VNRQYGRRLQPNLGHLNPRRAGLRDNAARQPRWLDRLTLRRSPTALIMAGGAAWTTAMVAEGALEMAPIAGWLWLTVVVTARRATRRRPPLR
jgi:hypothetical protein